MGQIKQDLAKGDKAWLLEELHSLARVVFYHTTHSMLDNVLHSVLQYDDCKIGC